MANDKDKTIRRQVLEEAADLIDGDRNVTYGTPTQNFENIAEMLTTRLGHKLSPGERITAADVADIMIIVKLCRNIAQTKRDNYVDIAGYAGCGYEAHEAEKPVFGKIKVHPPISGGSIQPCTDWAKGSIVTNPREEDEKGYR